MNQYLPGHAFQNRHWRKALFLPLVLAFLLTTLLALQSTPVRADGWVIECVDCPKNFEYMTDRSLRLDTEGHPHIAYGGDHLYYAWHDGVSWHLETVDDSPGVGMYASLTLDGSGYPHISYYDDTNGDLKYAYQDTSGWHIETVDSEGGSYPSLALDGDGYPHISYYGNGILKYAVYYHVSPWLNWRDPGRPLLLPAPGATVDVEYGNIPAPATLTAILSGPAIFADSSQVLTANITDTDGSYAFYLKPAAGATLGDTFTLEVTLADLRLERVGAIAWEVYLPLIHKKAP